MAASMRVANVRNKCASISLRCFLSKDRKVILSSFSHQSPNDSQFQHEKEEEEDFFGIPENFTLQQVRLGTGKKQQNESLENTGQLAVDSEIYRAGITSPSVTNGRSERRKVAQTTFSTTFGTISFDRTVTYTSPNLTTEDLASKAQEILTKLNIDKSTSTTSSGKAEQQKNKYSKEYVKQSDTNTSNQTPKQANQDFLKVSTNQRASTNYFDEVYFPDQSLEEDTSSSKQTFTHKFSRRIPDSTRGTTPNDCLEGCNSVTHHSSDEVKDDLKSGTFRKASLHESHHERTKPHSLNVIDEQYFGAVLKHGNEKVEHIQPRNDTEDPLLVQDTSNKQTGEVRPKNKSDVENKIKEAVDLNEIDLQYFGSASQGLNVQESYLQQETATVDKRTNQSFQNVFADYINPLNVKENISEGMQINKEDHEMLIKKGLGQKKPAAERKPKFETFNKQEIKEIIHQSQFNMNNEESMSAVAKDKKKHATGDQQKSKETSLQPQPTSDSNVITNEEFLIRQKIKKPKTESETDKPKTAYDVAMKIRQQLQQDSNIKLDSKGFRVLDNQVPYHLDKMTSADIVRMLKSRIIFDHEDFLAIDKPYGLPCYSQAKDRVSVTELLPAFTELLPRSYGASGLHLAQGLDRDVTGAIILAKNPEVAHIIRGMYKDSSLITQKYWAITKGVPTPFEGIVAIPIGEAKVGNIYKMVLRPRFLKDEKLIGRASKASSEKAVTQYKVLSSHLQSALVECILLTNVKHQIRLHLASGLGTPILGDHKYSNFAKMAPQKLHREMLDLLKTRQASVRHIIMHLHCRSIILKDYKGRMIFLTTHPPSHFRDNMRTLRIPKVV
ncbi:unnamed protein product [Candidula unifasciata]|uniref:Pseudouridylate synthase RPUSD4, mitochondrial n=1 Tax=Candidula unifasciata TaxID=100452 RepID=A0A8S3Z4E3_9EUPU|nr:unnamed protein product [Candidula unifasciata]